MPEERNSAHHIQTSQIKAPRIVNRVRRIIRDEITCGGNLELQSVRFDMQIIRPINLCVREAERHKSIIQRSIATNIITSSITCSRKMGRLM